MEEKQNNKTIIKKIIENLSFLIMIIIYIFIINLLYYKVQNFNFLDIINLSSIVILLISITIFEIAYHKDNDIIALHGIEILIMSIINLTMLHFSKKLNIVFGRYITIIVHMIAIYYVLKCAIIYTMEKRKYYKSLSDIHEIVSKEPIKKQAKKRKINKNAWIDWTKKKKCDKIT